jgi:flagellar biosynthetic protein FliP
MAVTPPAATLSAMTTTHPARSNTRKLVRFAGHYLEMVVAMMVGMVALAPVWSAAWPGLDDRPALSALVMATNMSVGMALWMRVRRHGWPHIAAMCAAMYVAFLVLLPPYWAGMISGDTLHGVGHMLMLPLMLVAMLRRH